MLLDEECKSCLFNSQMKKVEREEGSGENLEEFKSAVKKLCENPPKDYCAPLLMRDIDGIHRKIYGRGIDYTKEKTLFNRKLLEMEEELYFEINRSSDRLAEALKYAMASNYIDFARMSDLDEGAIKIVTDAAKRAVPDSETLLRFKTSLKNAQTLCFLHDNCGEIVLDKLLIRIIKELYPQIKITSVVRGGAIINDVTRTDAEEVGLSVFAEVADSGAAVPGTYLKEVSENTLKLLKESGVIISKGLGNLETLFGEGYNIFYSFSCKCGHIAERFSSSVGDAVFVYEGRDL